MTVEQSPLLSSKKISFSLKVFEYFCLAIFVYAAIYSVVFSFDKTIVTLGAASSSIFVFVFLVERKFVTEYQQSSAQEGIAEKAEVYTYLLTDGTSFQNNTITPARQKALKYSQELIDDYKKTRKNSRNVYYISQIVTIILSGVTPILVLVDKLDSGLPGMKWLPVIFPAIAAIVASLVTSFPFQETWIAANTTVELLEAEQEKFVLGVTPAYRCYDITDESQRQKKAKQAIESFINQVNTIHLKQFQKGNEAPLVEEKQVVEEKQYQG